MCRLAQVVTICILLCLCTIKSEAQRIHFTDTSNKWAMLYYDLGITAPMHTRYGVDSVISGQRYHRLVTTCFYAFPKMDLAVREDTVNGKIYFRFITARFWESGDTDTLEHLLFDYGLRLGDTLKTDYATHTHRYEVIQYDSVLLDNQYYKHWLLKDALRQGATLSYHFIEGIGTTMSPVYSVCSEIGFRAVQLRCFVNNGSRPHCSPSIPLPFSGLYPPDNTMPLSASLFDNDSSCIYRYHRVEVPSIERRGIPFLSAVPVSASTSLQLPTTISQSSLLILDILGRKLLERHYSDVRDIPIGRYLNLPGVYTYVLQDDHTGQRFKTRFLFQ